MTCSFLMSWTYSKMTMLTFRRALKHAGFVTLSCTLHNWSSQSHVVLLCYTTFVHIKMGRKSLLDRPGHSFSWCGVQNDLLLRPSLLEMTQCCHHSAVFYSPLGSALVLVQTLTLALTQSQQF